MCGICGFTGKLPDSKDVLTRMMDRIKHRGPDSAGQYITEKAAWGFRRLSIIDLDHGSQPMFNEDNSIVIVFNGEIYNYQTLREALIAKGHVFRNNSDTEVLVHGYEEYGTDLPKHCRGMFAFMIYDTKRILLSAPGIILVLNLFITASLTEIWSLARKLKVSLNIRDMRSR